jgi:hypothetical protein
MPKFTHGVAGTRAGLISSLAADPVAGGRSRSELAAEESILADVLVKE